MPLPHLRDVSNWQHPVDWQREATEVKAVYVKVAQGLTFTDPYASSHIKGARSHSITVGGYLYCTPGVGSGAQQADRLLALAPTRAGDLRPCLDCEWPDSPLNNNPAQLAAWYLGAVTRILQRLGVFPTLYGSPSYLARFTGYHPEVFGRCPLWVAHYGVPRPAVPLPWHSFAAWQWSQTARDPAIPGYVDDSLLADLPALRIPARATTAKTRRAAGRLELKPWQLKPLPQ